MQKHEDALPDTLEFERLKEHFEPYLRAQLAATSLPGGSAPSLSASTSMSSATAAAQHALARDIPGLSSSTSQHPGLHSHGGRKRKDKSGNKDPEHLAEYRSRIEVGAGGVLGMGGGDEDTDFMRLLEEVNEVASLERRWTSSWMPNLHSR
jgi:dynactin 4